MIEVVLNDRLGKKVGAERRRSQAPAAGIVALHLGQFAAARRQFIRAAQRPAVPTLQTDSYQMQRG